MFISLKTTNSHKLSTCSLLIYNLRGGRGVSNFFPNKAPSKESVDEELPDYGIDASGLKITPPK